MTVVEDPTAKKYATYYQYDVLGDLTAVGQAGTCSSPDPVATPCATGTPRLFSYSSLKRLLIATNPESGTTEYQYDNAGNLVRRKQDDAIVCYGTHNADDTCQLDGYDDLNRPTRQTYNDSTPAVTYKYDVADSSKMPANCPASNGPIGRLSSVGNSVSTNYYFYNQLGYTQCNRQYTSSIAYDFLYTTTPQGDWTQEVYPSGRSLAMTLDNFGRPTSVAGYATGVIYSPHGGIKQLKFGNDLVEQTSYNNQLQVASIKLGTASSSGSIWDLENSYQTMVNGNTVNNGNLTEQRVRMPGLTGWDSFVSTEYRYDSLNRLVLATEQPGSNGPICPDAGSHWCEQFDYDERGNRLITQHSNSGDAGIEPQTFGPDNRITGGAWQYDSLRANSRGNITKDATGFTFGYDAENRQKVLCRSDPNGCPDVAGASRTQYKYDGEGRRVERVTTSGMEIFVYDARPPCQYN